MRAVVIVAAIVIGVVGLGIWFVRGLPTHEYGPAGGQFLVAFPRPPFVKSLPGGITEYGTNPAVRPSSQPSSPSQVRYRYVAIGTVSEFAADAAFEHPKPFLEQLRRLHFHDAGDFKVTSESVTCNVALCTGRMTVRRGPWVWSVSAFGERLDVGRFLASFVPLG